MEEQTPFKPQEGPQERFMSTTADIAIYGGAAGGGKSYALLLEPIRNMDNSGFSAIIFRRTTPQITNPGGLWDDSQNIYAITGAKSSEQKLKWTFPSGAVVKFSHMEHETDKLKFQGSQIPFIGWDELTHFTESQFIYMLSRNRSVCGVPPYIRATCNPDSASWVRKFIDWWINPETGLPIPERDGEIRWFFRYKDELHWFDSRQEARWAMDQLQLPKNVQPKSLTFIAASVTDNKILMENDPGYMANLMALPRIEREQLLGGNWNISADQGIILHDWLKFYDPDELPPYLTYSWSADTAIKEGQENDYSAAQLWGEGRDGFYLVQRWKGKVPYPELKSKIISLYAAKPTNEFLIEDKGSGQQLIQDFKGTTRIPVIAMMPGRNMALKKIERVNFVSTLFESGKVFLPDPKKCPWVEEYIRELCDFPHAEHDDEVDATTQYLTRRLTKMRSGAAIGAPVATNDTLQNASTENVREKHAKQKESDMIKMQQNPNKHPASEAGLPSGLF